jgi:hypothetical protein
MPPPTCCMASPSISPCATSRQTPGRLAAGHRRIIEAGWEVIENTSWIIDRYRGETAALDYFGDSIINSTADMAMMVLGFMIAWRARFGSR